MGGVSGGDGRPGDTHKRRNGDNGDRTERSRYLDTGFATSRLARRPSGRRGGRRGRSVSTRSFDPPVLTERPHLPHRASRGASRTGASTRTSGSEAEGKPLQV